MTHLLVELSGEAPDLARWEAVSAAEALGGAVAETDRSVGSLVALEVPTASSATALMERLALARRCLRETEGAPRPTRPGEAGVFRRLGHGSSGDRDPAIHAAAVRWQAEGGRIDLERPDRRFWLAPTPLQGAPLLEEVGTVDRRAVGRRTITSLPFRRPIGLAPRLARAAANLARIRPGDRVLDPFLGTGALLAEAALLGARVIGVDRDPEMVRGALRNFAFLGVEAESLVVGDAGTTEIPGPAFDAVLTDLPYGRASGTGGEDATALARRVLPNSAGRVRTGGRVVAIGSGGPDVLSPPWARVVSLPLRVHRSLTREFRVYERRPTTE